MKYDLNSRVGRAVVFLCPDTPAKTFRWDRQVDIVSISSKKHVDDSCASWLAVDGEHLDWQPAAEELAEGGLSRCQVPM